MAPKRKRTDILGSVADIERRLPAAKADSIAAAALSEDVGRLIFKDLTDIDDDDDDHLENGADKRVKYNMAGVRLWNTALQLPPDVLSATMTTTENDYQRLLVKCRVLGFCVVDAGFVATLESCTESTSSCVYLYIIAIGAAKAVAGTVSAGKWSTEEMRMMRLVLGKASRYQDILSKDPTNRDEQGDGKWNGNRDDIARRNTKVKHLNQKRIVFELAQLLREKRFADAEELYETNVAPNDVFQMGSSGSSREVQEDLMTALFQHGKQLLAQDDFAGARKWLVKANLCFGIPTGDEKDAPAARKAVMHALAVALLRLETPEGLEEAREMVETLAHFKYGEDDHRVIMLRLKLYDSPVAESFQADEYAAVLLRLVGSFAFTADEFALLHHRIQKLHSKSPGLGCSVLDAFLLAMHSRQTSNATDASKWMKWLERLVITRVWLLAHQRQTEEELDAAQAVMWKLNIAIGADAAAAAQTIMWKKIEQGYQSKEYAMTMRWCQLALSRLFEAGGRANRPLIERKQLLCAVESGDMAAAQEAYRRFSEASRDEPMTKYLVYKMAVQLKDLALAGECLRCIAMSSEQRVLLNACVLHARNVKKPLFVAQALKRLADSVNRGSSYDFGAGESSKDAPMHTPGLFRCTILLLRDIIEGRCEGTKYDAKDAQGAVSDVLVLFQGVIDAVEMERDYPVPDRERLFSASELDWFCRVANSMGLKHCGTWDLRQTITLLRACIKLCDLLASQQARDDENEDSAQSTEFTEVTEPTGSTKMARIRLSSRFLIASGLAALVRSAAYAGAADKEQMADDCRAMREHTWAFSRDLASSPYLQDAKYREKLAVLLVFDFEGAIRLGNWEELKAICGRAAGCGTVDTLRVLGDTLLRAQTVVPSNVFVSVMRFLVGRLAASKQFGRKQLMRYYRCLFQSALYRDNDAAFDLLYEILGDRQDNEDEQEKEEKMRETLEEVQYMATIAFNEGLDWYAGGRFGKAREWMLAASQLAGMCDDDRKLQRAMGERFDTLRIDEDEAGEADEADVDKGQEKTVVSSPVVGE